MKFAICNETFVDWPLAAALAKTAEYGYTGVEIAPYTLAPDVRQITATQRVEIRRQIDAAGLEMIGLHWLLAKTEGLHLTSPESATRERTADYLSELARLCRDLGGGVLVLGSPQQRSRLAGVSPQQAQDYAADVLARCLPTLEETGTTLALEPLSPELTDFCTTAAETAVLIARLGSQHCRLHLDCAAMSTEAEPIPVLLERYQGVLAHFHANDPNRQGPGFGELDFLPILEALGRMDYRGWVSVEVFDYGPGIERLARESIEYLQTCLERLAQNPSPAAHSPLGVHELEQRIE